jgi:hypothetical protein
MPSPHTATTRALLHSTHKVHTQQRSHQKVIPNPRPRCSAPSPGHCSSSTPIDRGGPAWHGGWAPHLVITNQQHVTRRCSPAAAAASATSRTCRTAPNKSPPWWHVGHICRVIHKHKRSSTSHHGGLQRVDHTFRFGLRRSAQAKPSAVSRSTRAAVIPLLLRRW